MKKNLTPMEIFHQAMQLCENKNEITETACAFVVLGLAKRFTQ